MLGEFESFYYKRNVHNVSRYEKPNFLPAPHIICYIDSQQGKEGIPVSLPSLSEKTLEPMPSKVDLIKLFQFIMT